MEEKRIHFEFALQIRIKILFPNISVAKIRRKLLLSIKKCTKESLQVMNISDFETKEPSFYQNIQFFEKKTIHTIA